MSDLEKLKTEVSIHLTRILVLFGRLVPDTTARYLPMTVNLIVPLIRELTELEKKNPHVRTLLKESIEIREKHSKVFVIPPQLLADPSIEGLRASMCALSDPLIERYCQEEKQFLESALLEQKTPEGFLARAMEDCDLMLRICTLSNVDRLIAFRNWCREKLK